MSIRICRHCRKPVSFKDEACPHCKGKLHRTQFLIAFTVMCFLLLLAFSAVAYGYLAYKAAYEQAFCQEHIYARETVNEQATCQAICEQTCQDNNKAYSNSLFISEAYKTDSTQVTRSCDCTCSGCA